MGAVYRAVQVIDTSVKQLAVHAEKHSRRLEVQPSIVRDPSLDLPREIFVEQTVVSMACTGNAYWLIDFNDNDQPINLTVLNPNDVHIETTAWGTPRLYRYLGRDFEPHRIKHLKLMRVPGKAKGLGPIQAAQTELRGALDIVDHAGNWFPKSGMPRGGYLTTELPLVQSSADETRDKWLESVNKDGLPVTHSGLKFVSAFLSPKDAQWIEARQFDTTGAARLFGMPASIMLAAVEGGSQSYANIEQDFIWFTRFTIAAYTVEIETAWSQLVPRGTRVRFNLDSLLRTDTKTRYDAHEVGIRAGFLTPNEARALEGLDPLPGGDELVRKTQEAQVAAA